MKYAFIQTESANHAVYRLCSILGVSRSGYYDWRERTPSKRDIANQQLLQRIKTIYTQHHGRYGSPRIHETLKHQGHSASLGRVERLMSHHGIAAQRTKHHRSVYILREQQKAAPNHLARDFTATQPNEKWVSDITFIPTREGYLYLAVMLDLYSRAIVGWAMSSRMKGQLVLDALSMAIEHRGKPKDVLVHSDQGSQYTAEAYQQLLQSQQMTCSMSRKGECHDNAVAESFFHTLKEELTYGVDYRTQREAKQAIFEYIEMYYNRQRLHSTLGYQSPADYERMNAA